MRRQRKAWQLYDGDGGYGRCDGNSDGRHDGDTTAMTAMDGAMGTGGEEAITAG